MSQAVRERCGHESLASLAAQVFQSALTGAGSKALAFANLADKPADWDQVLAHCAYVPVAYTRANLRYQHLYQQCHSEQTVELSQLVYWDGHPVAVWPLALACVDGEVELSSFGQPVLAPLFDARLPSRSGKQIVAACMQLATAMALRFGLPGWRSQHGFTARAGLPEWHLQAMAQGARAHVGHELMLDLSPPLEDIRRSLRKSYRPLISQGERLWRIQCLEQVGDEAWQQFRQLHRRAAGRQTRSDASWQCQREQVNQGAAFLVCLHDADERMVGAGLFTLSRDEAVYAVGAYDRDLFDRPLGHVVQFRAIQRMKELGLSWYRIGDRPYCGDPVPAEDKELRIAEFKQGFASHLYARFGLWHPAAVS